MTLPFPTPGSARRLLQALYLGRLRGPCGMWGTESRFTNYKLSSLSICFGPTNEPSRGTRERSRGFEKAIWCYQHVCCLGRDLEVLGNEGIPTPLHDHISLPASVYTSSALPMDSPTCPIKEALWLVRMRHKAERSSDKCGTIKGQSQSPGDGMWSNWLATAEGYSKQGPFARNC